MGGIGLTGLSGPQGSRGLTGEKGPVGDQGENGLQGLNGEHGKKGIKGEKGSTGNKGPFSVKGQTGERGQKGEKGSAGKSAITPSCGSEWEQLMNSCYFFQFQSKKTWNEAKIYCHNMGGFLVKIDNAFENWFFQSYIKSDKSAGDVWIGAHDFVREVDNTSLTYTDWYPGEPNNSHNKEDCACLNSDVE
ncbi:Hypothetical predicted protein [Mytilus galloprovincialis]|uniref:C-type lectin domain-containing protein n=1 Tax=Mytilus galloprovincialis TaxID=29158 RepID=A0A8B6F1Q5_MYTGA|nr:Hypothetical predicted protein [Mytilus galloprovincialis]